MRLAHKVRHEEDGWEVYTDSYVSKVPVCGGVIRAYGIRTKQEAEALAEKLDNKEY